MFSWQPLALNPKRAHFDDKRRRMSAAELGTPFYGLGNFVPDLAIVAGVVSYLKTLYASLQLWALRAPSMLSLDTSFRQKLAAMACAPAWTNHNSFFGTTRHHPPWRNLDHESHGAELMLIRDGAHSLIGGLLIILPLSDSSPRFLLPSRPTCAQLDIRDLSLAS